MTKPVGRTILVIYCATITAAIGQHEGRVVWGKIRDFTSGDPLSGVTVASPSGRNSAITDSSGTFRLSLTAGTKPGESIVITASKPGFAAIANHITVSADARPLEFRLSRTAPSARGLEKGAANISKSRSTSVRTGKSEEQEPRSLDARTVYEVLVRYEDPHDEELVRRLGEYIDVHEQLKVHSLELLGTLAERPASSEIRFFDGTGDGPAVLLESIVEERLALLGRSQIVYRVPGEPSRRVGSIPLEVFVAARPTKPAGRTIDEITWQHNSAIQIAVIPTDHARQKNDPCIQAVISTLQFVGFKVENLQHTSIWWLSPYGAPAIYYFDTSYSSRASELRELLSTWIAPGRVYYLSPAKMRGHSSLRLEEYLTKNPNIKIHVNIGRYF